MKNCYLVKIPFATKGEINKRFDNSLKIIGYANYVYDFESGEVIHEFLELTKANYRLTDKAMIIPTDYYKKLETRKFRDNFLDKITNHNPLKIQKSKFHNLDESQIEKINNYLRLETSTIRNQFSYFQGSNVSGAGTNSKASPLVCIEQEYMGCNFANPMKKLEGKKTINYRILKTISLTNLIEDNEKFMKIFEQSNIWYFNDKLVDKSQWINDLIIDNQYDNINIDSWVVPDDLDEKISTYLNAYFNGLIENNDLNSHKRVLRRFFGSAVKKELANNKIPFYSTKKNLDAAVIQNAHIIGFSGLVNQNTKESVLKAISPFNVLRINADTHIRFDADKITFDLNGNMIDKNQEIKEPFLDMENMPKETIHFIEENYEYWKINKINKK